MKADEPKLLRVSRAAHELGLHPFTVRKWIKAGKIQAIRVGNEARVPRTEIERLAGETQLERLQAWAKEERAGKQTLMLSDIGSGLSATRRELQRLLRLVREDQVAEIVVTSPDRLTRFGLEYLQALFDSFGVTLTVLDPGEDKTAEQELTDDMLALLASFSGRLYGMRSHQQKELLQCAQAVINNP